MQQIHIGPINVICWGKIAADALRTSFRVKSFAVFKHSCYLRTNHGQLVCLLSAAQPAGPLNVLCQLPYDFDWRRYIRLNSAIRVSAKGLHTDANDFFSIERAQIWQAPDIDRPHPSTLAQGLSQLTTCLKTTHAGVLPGLGSLSAWLLGSPVQPIPARITTIELKHTFPVVSALYDWLCQNFPDSAPIPKSAAQLLGFGAGLTPSGDDFLAGLLIALRALGLGTAAAKLAAELLPLAPATTHSISVAHLQCAAAGLGSEPLHQVLVDLCKGGHNLSTALNELNKIGHSSGWDALAGVTLASLAYSRQFLDKTGLSPHSSNALAIIPEG